MTAHCTTCHTTNPIQITDLKFSAYRGYLYCNVCGKNTLHQDSRCKTTMSKEVENLFGKLGMKPKV